MSDLIPLACFAGLVLATVGLIGVCEWLRAATTPVGDRTASIASTSRSEVTR